MIKPFFLKTNDVPMRSPEPIARRIPTVRYWVGEDEEDSDILVASGNQYVVQCACVGAVLK